MPRHLPTVHAVAVAAGAAATLCLSSHAQVKKGASAVAEPHAQLQAQAVADLIEIQCSAQAFARTLLGAAAYELGYRRNVGHAGPGALCISNWSLTSHLMSGGACGHRRGGRER